LEGTEVEEGRRFLPQVTPQLSQQMGLPMLLKKWLIR